MRKVFHILVEKIQYNQDVISHQINLQIQCHSNLNPNWLFHRYQQSDSKFYRERHKAPITSMIFKEKNKDRGLALFNFKKKKKSLNDMDNQGGI